MATLKKYPLDLTGSLPANRVAGETRQIVHDEERYFIPAGFSEVNGQGSQMSTGQTACSAFYTSPVTVTFS